jgi:hypothetical protein
MTRISSLSIIVLVHQEFPIHFGIFWKETRKRQKLYKIIYFPKFKNFSSTISQK